MNESISYFWWALEEEKEQIILFEIYVLIAHTRHFLHGTYLLRLWKKQGLVGGSKMLGVTCNLKGGAPLKMTGGWSGRTGPKIASFLSTPPVLTNNSLNIPKLGRERCKKGKVEVLISISNLGGQKFVSISGLTVFNCSLDLSTIIPPTSKNLALRISASCRKSLSLVQFLLSLRNWLLGTDLSHDGWWQLVTSI